MTDIYVRGVRRRGSDEAKKRGKASVLITLSHDEKTEQYEIDEGTYREIGCPLSGENLDGDRLLLIKETDERRRALKRALNALSYSDKSKSALAMRLRALGFSKEAVEYAIDECMAHGYISEERSLETMISGLANRSLLGPYKIIPRLLSRGYRLETIRAVIKRLTDNGEIDFESGKERLFEKNPTPQSAEEKQKLLHKYGYIK